jgi:hypothetical protein
LENISHEEAQNYFSGFGKIEEFDQCFEKYFVTYKEPLDSAKIGYQFKINSY